ncbi:DUF6602 domain-containing protein [Olivibacter oleidegradans]|uniref:DUF6602 domain-containing protein n=1 Tax=Olivibacter oleidegradans TaxID=760123 RepID=A0ABV6HDH0_9SPHI
MNIYYRKILDAQIKKALTDAKLASKMKHPYLTGRLREIVLHLLIEPLLNNNYAIGNGKIIDYKGNISGEIDLCIYSKNLHPPIFFSRNDKMGIFPIESVLNTIEVKSELNKRAMLESFAKFQQIDNELIFTAAMHDENQDVVATYFIKPHYSIFAFNTKTERYSADKVLKLYSTIDPSWDTTPLISSICIAGKGWLCNTDRGWLHISYDEINDINNEIIGFISTLVNDLPRIEGTRGAPHIGYYLTDPLNVDKLINKIFVNKPWEDGEFVFSNR